MAKKQVSTKKVKKKKWFPVIAPKMFNGKVLGESLLTESSLMKGKFMTMNLMNITGNPKQQNVNIQFRIVDVKEGRGMTNVIKYELLSSAVKRQIRRGRNKVDDSFLLKSSEGRLRVKTLTITKGRVSKAVETQLRLETRELLKKLLVQKPFEATVEDMLKAIIQKEVKTTISKITPVRNFDIRVFKFEMNKDVDELEYVAEEVVAEPEATEAKPEAQSNKVASVTESNDSGTQKQDVSVAPEDKPLNESKVEETPKAVEVKEVKEEKPVKKEEKAEEVKEEKPKPAKKAPAKEEKASEDK